jgi:hypothetical protein
VEGNWDTATLTIIMEQGIAIVEIKICAPMMSINYYWREFLAINVGHDIMLNYDSSFWFKECKHVIYLLLDW